MRSFRWKNIIWSIFYFTWFTKISKLLILGDICSDIYLLYTHLFVYTKFLYFSNPFPDSTISHQRYNQRKKLTPACGDFFFLGRVNEVFFALWSISSHVGVQIGRELVRLITLISLNKFLTNITSAMSLKKFSRTTFRWSVVKKTLIFGVYSLSWAILLIIAFTKGKLM